MIGLDIIATLGGMILPPAFDMVKKMFVKEDTPQQTLNSIAVTKPEILPAYVEANAKATDSQIGWFNRDVVGTPSQWVIDLRSAIRPIGVIMAFLVIAGNMIVQDVQLDSGAIYFCESIIGSWFGSRFGRG